MELLEAKLSLANLDMHLVQFLTQLDEAAPPQELLQVCTQEPPDELVVETHNLVLGTAKVVTYLDVAHLSISLQELSQLENQWADVLAAAAAGNLDLSFLQVRKETQHIQTHFVPKNL
jgi:hypothetical protein